MAQAPDTFVVTAPQNLPVSIDDVLITPTGGSQGRLADKVGGGGGSGVGTIAAGSNIAITNPTGPTATVALGTIAATSLFGNAGTVAGNLAAITPGANLTLTAAGTLNATGGTLVGVATIAAGSNIAITNPTGPTATVAVGTIAATSLFGNAGTVAGNLAAIAVGANLTLTAGGTLNATAGSGATVGNLGAVVNSGTVQINNSITVTGTAAGTLTISPTTGTSDVILNMPAAGGTVTVTSVPSFARQRMEWDVKQGATFGVLNLGTVFHLTGAVSTFTLTPTANAVDRLSFISPDGTSWVPWAINQGATL
jgi:hypothetical protein